jgi:hypothetical protein
MLKFCQSRASPEIVSLAANISLAAKSETGLNIDTIDISSLGDNLAYFEVFILWDALSRESNCVSLVHLLARIGLAAEDRKTCRALQKKMTALNKMSRQFTQCEKKVSVITRLSAYLLPSLVTAKPPAEADEVRYIHNLYLHNVIRMMLQVYNPLLVPSSSSAVTSPPSCSRASASASASDACPVAARSGVVSSSPRQAIELCDDDGDVLDLSHLSQLSCADKADDVMSTTVTGKFVAKFDTVFTVSSITMPDVVVADMNDEEVEIFID